MKKQYYLIFAFVFVSCGTTSSEISATSENVVLSEAQKENLNALKNFGTYYINESLTIDARNTSNKVGYYDETSELKGYAKVSNNNSYFYKVATIQEYFNSTHRDFAFNGTHVEHVRSNEGVLSMLGLAPVIDNSITNSCASGTVNVFDIINVAEFLYYDLGSFVTYNDFIEDSMIPYTMYFNADSLVSIDIDVTRLVKYLYPMIETATKSYSFQQNFDSSLLLPYPTYGGNQGDNIEELKEGGVKYIDDVYSKFQYVSGDLNFIRRYPTSGRITYEYTSSMPNILNSNGEFTAPSEDTSLVLNVDILVDNVKYDEKSYSLTAYKKATGTGELGSATNHIYKGRTPIEAVDIYFIEMNKQYGDAVYIKAGEFDMLIDAGQGEDGYYVSRFLQENMLDSELDMVVATHAHGDHIGGMSSVFSTIKDIGYALDYGYDRAEYGTSASVRNTMKSRSQKYIAVTDALNENNGVIWISDDFYITVLDTDQYIKPGVDINGADDNSASVTFIMTYKSHSYYFSGDLDSSGESYLASSNQLKDVDLMKASHHASQTGNSNTLLNRIKPEMVVVSTALVSKGSTSENAGSQPHPNANALSRFYSSGAKVYCNFTMGTAHVRSLGTGSLSINGLGVRTPYYIGGRVVEGEENMEFRYTKWAGRYRS